MKNFLRYLAALALGVAVAGSALATTNPNSYSAGYSQQTNSNGLNGLVTSGGPVPTTSGTCGSGVIGVAVGGSTAGQVTTTVCTTLTLILTGAVSSLVVSDGLNDGLNATNSSTAPNGAVCFFIDETHPAVYVGTYTAATAKNGVYTTYTCTSAALTITASDLIKYVIVAY